MTLDASSLLLSWHDCVNSKGLGDGQKIWQLLQQRLRSNKTTRGGKKFSETLFNAMVLKDIPQRYERIKVQESFNPADNFVELRQPLTNFEECRRQRVDVEEDEHVARSANNASHQFGIHSSYKSHPRRTFF